MPWAIRWWAAFAAFAMATWLFGKGGNVGGGGGGALGDRLVDAVCIGVGIGALDDDDPRCGKT